MTSIKEEIERMKVFDEVLETMEDRAQSYDKDAESYLKQAQEIMDEHRENGENYKDEDIWQYVSYKESNKKACMIRKVACEIEAIAMRTKK